MSLKKFLISNRMKSWKNGQATVEYFVLLTLLASLTIIGISYFFQKVQYNTDRVLQFAVDAWKQPVQGDFDTTGMGISGMDDSMSH